VGLINKLGDLSGCQIQTKKLGIYTAKNGDFTCPNWGCFFLVVRDGLQVYGEFSLQPILGTPDFFDKNGK
jgi:hypothetical protein